MAADAPIYVVVCSRGGGPEGDGPIVLETEMARSTLEAARGIAARFDGKPRMSKGIGGPSRIARLVFDDGHPERTQDMLDALRQWRAAERTGDAQELDNARAARDAAIAAATGSAP
jgi:hypothetical protein